MINLDNIMNELQDKKDVQIMILTDIIDDVKQSVKFLKRIILALSLLVIIMTTIMISLYISHKQHIRNASINNIETKLIDTLNKPTEPHININTDNEATGNTNINM